jgi:hypothetical protein
MFGTLRNLPGLDHASMIGRCRRNSGQHEDRESNPEQGFDRTRRSLPGQSGGLRCVPGFCRSVARGTPGVPGSFPSGGQETHMSKPDKHPSGQPVGGQWAQQQKKGMEKQQQGGGGAGRPQQGGQHDSNARRQQQAGQGEGDERTPDKPIGEMAYAQRDPAKKKTGEF